MSDKGIFTSVIRVKGNDKYKVIPVKSSQEIDKEIWIEISKVISRIYASVPVKRGNIVCKNVLNTGVDIICTRDILNI